MNSLPTTVTVQYNSDHSGTLSVPEDGVETPIWARLKLAVRTKKLAHTLINGEIRLSWPETLGIVRELGSKSTQKNLNFRFRPDENAAIKLQAFTEQIQKTREQRRQISETLTPKSAQFSTERSWLHKTYTARLSTARRLSSACLKQWCKLFCTRRW